MNAVANATSSSCSTVSKEKEESAPLGWVVSLSVGTSPDPDGAPDGSKTKVSLTPLTEVKVDSRLDDVEVIILLEIVEEMGAEVLEGKGEEEEDDDRKPAKRMLELWMIDVVNPACVLEVEKEEEEEIEEDSTTLVLWMLDVANMGWVVEEEEMALLLAMTATALGVRGAASVEVTTTGEEVEEIPLLLVMTATALGVRGAASVEVTTTGEEVEEMPLLLVVTATALGARGAATSVEVTTTGEEVEEDMEEDPANSLYTEAVLE